MLTRIEIDGFKTFDHAALDVSPFLVILGPNASGKSNLFDAIRFLSQLAVNDLRAACRGLRGEPHELFRRDAEGEPGTRLELAVEVLLEPKVRDPWGQEVELAHTRVRYEVGIERRTDSRGIERLIVTQESATALSRSEDRWLTRPAPQGILPEVSDAFRDRAMKIPPRHPGSLRGAVRDTSLASRTAPRCASGYLPGIPDPTAKRCRTPSRSRGALAFMGVGYPSGLRKRNASRSGIRGRYWYALSPRPRRGRRGDFARRVTASRPGPHPPPPSPSDRSPPAPGAPKGSPPAAALAPAP